MSIRKTLIIKEVTETSDTGKACDPITRVVAMAVIRNPYAGQFGDDLVGEWGQPVLGQPGLEADRVVRFPKVQLLGD